VDNEAVGAEMHERQTPQAVERLPRRVAGQHGLEQRERRAAGHGGGREGAARRGVEPVEVEAAEMLDDGVDGAVRDGHRRALRAAGRGEPEGERVPAGDAVDPGVGARAAQDLLGVGRGEVVHRQRRQEVAVPQHPGRGRRAASGDHDAHVGGQRRHERRGEPRVDHREPLVGVDDEHDAPAERAERPGGVGRRLRLGAGRRGEGGHEAAGRGLDLTAVEHHRVDAGVVRVGGERAQQRGLADAGDPVDHRHERPVVGHEAEQRGALAVAAGERRGAVPQQRSERGGHLADIASLGPRHGAGQGASRTRPGRAARRCVPAAGRPASFDSMEDPRRC
jgi:hypothetical protein